VSGVETTAGSDGTCTVTFGAGSAPHAAKTTAVDETNADFTFIERVLSVSETLNAITNHPND